MRDLIIAAFVVMFVLAPPYIIIKDRAHPVPQQPNNPPPENPEGPPPSGPVVTV